MEENKIFLSDELEVFCLYDNYHMFSPETNERFLNNLVQYYTKNIGSVIYYLAVPGEEKIYIKYIKLYKMDVANIQYYADLAKSINERLLVVYQYKDTPVVIKYIRAYGFQKNVTFLTFVKDKKKADNFKSYFLKSLSDVCTSLEPIHISVGRFAIVPSTYNKIETNTGLLFDVLQNGFGEGFRKSHKVIQYISENDNMKSSSIVPDEESDISDMDPEDFLFDFSYFSKEEGINAQNHNANTKNKPWRFPKIFHRHKK